MAYDQGVGRGRRRTEKGMKGKEKEGEQQDVLPVSTYVRRED